MAAGQIEGQRPVQKQVTRARAAGGNALLFALLLTLSGPASVRAEAAAAVDAGVTVTVVEPAGPCEPWVDRQRGTPRLRAHLDVFVPCVIEETVYRQLVAEALRSADEAQADTMTIALGRIDDYPWLAQALAEAALADAGWNAQRGKPRSGNLNAFVQHLLLTDALRTRLAPPGWALGGVSVEKVLVMPYGSVAGSGKVRVPVDAQTWLRFQRATVQ